MENRKLNSKTTAKNGKQSKSKSMNAPMPSSQLMKLFEDELKDIYWAEKALTKAIPKLIKNATSQELIDALTSHLAETENQVTRIEHVFESIDKKAVAMCDAGIISAGQKVEHYEIASYGTLRQFAETLGLTEAVSLLAATLEEEKAADEKLSEVATSAINVEAAEIEA